MGEENGVRDFSFVSQRCNDPPLVHPDATLLRYHPLTALALQALHSQPQQQP